MKRIAIIEQTILLDDNSPWRNLSQFDRFFEDFCASHGLEVEPVAVTGNANKSVVFVSKIQAMPQPNTRPMTFKKAGK